MGETIMALNNFSVTGFTSRTLGTFLAQQSPFMGVSYRGVDEFAMPPKGYKPRDTISIKIPGYPTSQRGMVTVPESIIDRVIPYTVSDNDLYSTSYSIDIRELTMKIEGGILAFTKDPNRDGNGDKGINPQAKEYIDNYVTPSGEVILGDLEVTLATKCKNAAFYTPIDEPGLLSTINSYSKISAVNSLMNQLGFMKRNRFGIMNNIDSNQVANSLQNRFSESANTEITKNARLGGPDFGRLANFDIFESINISGYPTNQRQMLNMN